MTRNDVDEVSDEKAPRLGLNANRLAAGLGVNRSTISRLLAGQQPLTPVMAARLGAFFQVPTHWWLLMQAEHDAAVVSEDPALIEGVTPMEPDPDVLLTPKGGLRLAPVSPSEEQPLTISSDELDRLPQMASSPTPLVVREVRYDSGSLLSGTHHEPDRGSPRGSLSCDHQSCP